MESLLMCDGIGERTAWKLRPLLKTETFPILQGPRSAPVDSTLWFDKKGGFFHTTCSKLPINIVIALVDKIIIV